MTLSKRSRDDFRERAYVAASRRTDRNIKARMESALMASEIHKKRTGKSLHVTEDIVMGDAPHEEEQDGWLRGLRPQTCPVVPKRMSVEGMSKESLTSGILGQSEEEWRENEINRLFAQVFPNFGRQFQLPVRTILEEGNPPREPISQNIEGSNQQRPHEHLQNGSPPSNPDEPAGDTPSRPREDSLIGETPSLCDSHATTLTSCSPSLMPDHPSEVGIPSEFFDPNNTEGLYANHFGEGFIFKTDDFNLDGDVNEWLQDVWDSGDMLEMTGWDSQPFQGTMDDWWTMLVDDSAQPATSTF